MDENRYPVETNGYTRALCAELHELQMKGVACDVSLLAEDGEISAHKIVLMAGSMYFYRCLTFYSAWKDTSKLVLPGISVLDLANVVKYIYSGTLSEERTMVTLQVCEKLEIQSAVKILNDRKLKERLTMSNDSVENSIPASNLLTRTTLPAPKAKSVSSSNPSLSNMKVSPVTATSCATEKMSVVKNSMCLSGYGSRKAKLITPCTKLGPPGCSFSESNQEPLPVKKLKLSKSLNQSTQIDSEKIHTKDKVDDSEDISAETIHDKNVVQIKEEVDDETYKFAGKMDVNESSDGNDKLVNHACTVAGTVPVTDAVILKDEVIDYSYGDVKDSNAENRVESSGLFVDNQKNGDSLVRPATFSNNLDYVRNKTPLPKIKEMETNKYAIIRNLTNTMQMDKDKRDLFRKFNLPNLVPVVQLERLKQKEYTINLGSNTPNTMTSDKQTSVHSVPMKETIVSEPFGNRRETDTADSDIPAICSHQTLWSRCDKCNIQRLAMLKYIEHTCAGIEHIKNYYRCNMCTVRCDSKYLLLEHRKQHESDHNNTLDECQAHNVDSDTLSSSCSLSENLGLQNLSTESWIDDVVIRRFTSMKDCECHSHKEDSHDTKLLYICPVGECKFASDDENKLFLHRIRPNEQHATIKCVCYCYGRKAGRPSRNNPHMLWYESERLLEFGNLQPGDYIVPDIQKNTNFTDNELIKDKLSEIENDK